jgi:hypothetical protein
VPVSPAPVPLVGTDPPAPPAPPTPPVAPAAVAPPRLIGQAAPTMPPLTPPVADAR